jgi:hypothetical protein
MEGFELMWSNLTLSPVHYNFNFIFIENHMGACASCSKEKKEIVVRDSFD